MAKKYIPLIAIIIAVIAIIVIAIMGSNPDTTNKDIYVTEVKITNVEDSTYEQNGQIIKRFYMTDDVTNVVDGKTTFKIDYTVLPANATNKTVTFTSSDNAIATVNENGLVTFLKNEPVFITLKANDASKKTAICQLLWEANSDANLTIDIIDENISIGSDDAVKLYSFENEVLYLFEGVNYSLDTTLNIALSEQDNLTISQGVLSAESVGEASAILSDETNEKTLQIVVVKYINNFLMGTNYSNYKQTTSDLSSTEFLNQTANIYKVGVDSTYYFDIVIQDQNNQNISLSDANLEYSIYLVEDDNKTLLSNNEVFLVNEDGTLSFKESSVGKQYQIVIEPKYNFLNRSALQFDFIVVNGVNVFSHEDLKTNFADLSVNNIILHSNIIPTIEDNQLDPDGKLINYANLTDNNGVTGDIYTRLYKEEDILNGNLDISIEGNYFKINASSVPYLTTNFSYSSHENLTWTESSGYPCASVQTGIFKIQENTADSYLTGVKKEFNINFNISNLELEGNTTTGIIYETDKETGEVILPDDEAAVIAKQGSSSAGFLARGAISINTDNVVILKTNIGLYVTGSQGGVSANYTNIYDSWGNGIFGWRTTTIDLQNTTISKAGGAAINISDATVSDKYSEDWLDTTIIFGENVNIYNFVSGTEGYFVVNGLSSVVPSLKASLNPQLATFNKTLLKQENIEGVNYSMFNFAIQFLQAGANELKIDTTIQNVGVEDGWTTYVNGMWLERQGQFLVNSNNPSEKYPITGTNCKIEKKTDTQITIKYFNGYDNENNPNYIVSKRTSDYYQNIPVVSTFGGVGISGVSKISNVDDAFLVAGVTGGYMTSEDFASDILQNNGSSPIATLLNSEEQLINGLKEYGINLISVKSKIKEKITALGTDLTSGLGAFASLDDMKKLLYLSDYEMLNTINTNIDKYNELLKNEQFSVIHSALTEIINGYNLIQTSAKSNSTLISGVVAITCNNDLINLKDEEGDLNLIELKINNEALGDFSGILIYTGLYNV